MYRDGAWGDGNMLAAACRLYGVRINVYREDNAIPVVISDTVPYSSASGRLMNIAFVGESRGKEPTHYISLVPSCQMFSSGTVTAARNGDKGLQQCSATESSTPSPAVTVHSEASNISALTVLNTENYT